MANQKSKSKGNPIKFEEALEKLESLIIKLEDDGTTLESSLAVFEEGIKLTRDAQKALLMAEQKIVTLLEKGGEPILTEGPNTGETD